MHSDFVVQVKCTIFRLNNGLRVNLDLFEHNKKRPTNPFIYQVLVRPILSTKSKHNTFVVQATHTIFGLNRGLRVYFDFNAPGGF